MHFATCSLMLCSFIFSFNMFIKRDCATKFANNLIMYVFNVKQQV